MHLRIFVGENVIEHGLFVFAVILRPLDRVLCDFFFVHSAIRILEAEHLGKMPLQPYLDVSHHIVDVGKLRVWLWDRSILLTPSDTNAEWNTLEACIRIFPLRGLHISAAK